jgi:hypothetical protein
MQVALAEATTAPCRTGAGSPSTTHHVKVLSGHGIQGEGYGGQPGRGITRERGGVGTQAGLDGAESGRCTPCCPMSAPTYTDC